MNDKNTHTNTHTNVWQKPTHKCMKKNTHTNVWQKHAYKILYKCMRKTRIQNRIQMYEKNLLILEQWAANYSAEGAWGYSAFPKGTSAVTRRLTANPQAVSPPIPFFERWVGIELTTLWSLDYHTHHCATADPNTNIKIYERNTHANIWKKHAYKCMKKTRIQMYDKNTHTNVWKKHA